MIVWESRAQQELHDIYDFIFFNSPQNAEHIITELVSITESISNMPFKYPKEPYFNNDNIRFVPKWTYKIIYFIGDNDITILSVFNTSQNSIRISR
ncbi:type II toxin-antitoxin system RelE/ParE family toxin [Flavobacterium branchiarum]|uniref:Type II toxin-antitoxin system RelE/ParE family toxin n=1 Tax=Flavobacterium branchiarum TaxID=1114870 RepID=A0ABV5FS19_9FLAO|nr:type II toxin-antitoxin system RelE/ParE family toxin [Flavobacterium branchiarum]MDN3673025.1 type II toxin-antitoxin system RelE/ParE family toxin [Flavobacterium branchiarum]